MPNAAKTIEASLYDVLKIKPNCTRHEVSSAWTILQKTLASNTPQYQAAKTAYETLIDPVKREIYNNFEIFKSSYDLVDNNYNFSSVFLMNRDVELVVGKLKSTNKNQTCITLSLGDFYSGKTVDIKARSPKPCSQCHNFAHVRPCPDCAMLPIPKMPMCQTCNNLRTVTIPYLCKVCNGAKYLIVDSKTEAVIKPGMLEGQKVRCSNNTTVVVLKQTSHSIFSRQGNDLYMKKSISLAQALCGIRFVIEHLDGRKLLVSSPVGNVLHPGCRKVIPKEGMPILNSIDGQKGDLIIIFLISIPNSLPKSSAIEIEEFLPERPAFSMPNNPETEEYRLTDFDPSFKLNKGVRYDEAYHDDKHDSTNPLLQPKKQCTHQ